MTEAPRHRSSGDRVPHVDDALEQAIVDLLDPGLRANAWRRDYEAFRRRRIWDEHHHTRRVRLLRRVWRNTGQRGVLDVGTGRGGLAVALAREGYRMVALDLRRSCCRVTRLRGQRYALDLPAVQARAEQLPFADETYGAVICRDVLEHCTRPGLLLAELCRVLHRGGSCFLTVINRWCWIDPHYHLAGLSFVPRPLVELYIRWRGRSKHSSQDHQRFSDMHYFRYGEFIRWANAFGFSVRDLRAEQLDRYRHDGIINALRWLRERLLRPLSLQSNHFEFLLTKPRHSTAARAAS